MEREGTVAIIDVECPRCNGMGEVIGSTPNVRARYVRRAFLTRNARQAIVLLKLAEEAHLIRDS